MLEDLEIEAILIGQRAQIEIDRGIELLCASATDG
jgi:hypothetical protein